MWLAPEAPIGATWCRKRLWVLPEAYALLQPASATAASTMAFHTQASGLRLGFLGDHQARLSLLALHRIQTGASSFLG